MRYNLLGSLEVVHENTPMSISARKVETLLIVLLIRVGHVVSSDQLIGEIWGGQPPRRAAAGLHVYVSDLRKFLGRREGDQRPIVTCSPGYMLQRSEDEIDFQIFLDLLDAGRKAVRTGRFEDAVTRFESALALWRGPVLGTLGEGPIVGSFVTWLTEQRVDCLELLVESQFHLGRHREMIGLLSSLVAENPLHEAFYRQLMLGLYRCERKADALRVYQSAREALREELGLEPCRSLQQLQRAVLADDEALSVAPLAV